MQWIACRHVEHDRRTEMMRGPDEGGLSRSGVGGPSGTDTWSSSQSGEPGSTGEFRRGGWYAHEERKLGVEVRAWLASHASSFPQ
jgi:hypothetical protein